MRPAPYLARAMWVQEEALGEAIERAELERLLRASYDLVAAPKSKWLAKPAAGGGRSARARPATRTRRQGARRRR